MLRLKVKHKLLLIWLGSIVLTLSVMAALFEYQIGSLHQKDARTAIADAINVLHHDLELEAQLTEQSSLALSERADLVASMSMIDSYQDPANYQAGVFDVEKSKIALELAQHAIATGTDMLAFYDTHNVLTAFYLSTTAGGNGAGYVSFKNAKQVPYVQTAQGGFTATDDAYMEAIMRQLVHLEHVKSIRPKITHAKNSYLLINTAKTMERTRSSGKVQNVGTVVVGRILDATFKLGVARATGMDFHILYPEEHDQGIPPSALDAKVMAHDVPKLELNGDSAPDHSSAHSWFSTDNLYVGTVRMDGHKGQPIYFIFTQDKDALQSTLNAFRNTALLVLLITGLTLVPIGVFFLNRFITRPIESLVVCADNLRHGQNQAMEGFSSTDEFGDLANSFQVMSSAVIARENALTQSQASLKNAQRMARIGNWEWNLKSNTLHFSDELHTILDRTPESMGTTLESLFISIHPDDIPTVKRHIFDASKHGVPFKMEHSIILPNGEKRYVIHQGEVVQDGDTSRLNATIQDITDRYLLERAKRNLISTVSHELRTPLTSISGTLGLALGGALGDIPDQLKEMLATANKNAKQLGLLIDDLLDIEKISNGSMTFDFKKTSIDEIIANAVETNQTLAQPHDITLYVEGDVDDLYVRADADRISQVMSNLLSNAIKFSDPGERVLIKAERFGANAAISISDNGPGIPEDFRPHVFERFAQADQSPTRTDQKGGTGLGLSITKAIVEMHNGDISFESISAPALYHGTTFTFTLPIWDEKPSFHK